MIAGKLAAEFVMLRAKHLVYQMLKCGYEEECKNFFHDVEELYTSCLVDVDPEFLTGA